MINYSIVMRSVNANLFEINQAKSRQQEGDTADGGISYSHLWIGAYLDRLFRSANGYDRPHGTDCLWRNSYFFG